MTKVLFVCTGNTCRSPMAEAILRSMNIEGLEVKSAGLFANDGGDASEHAKQVLKKHNMYHPHKSTMLKKTEIVWADIILTMTIAHANSILQTFPESHGKVFPLKKFVHDDNADVLDPFGGLLSTYESTYTELKELIMELPAKMKSMDIKGS
ncbi:low molecular weight protein arginine phosphatase [Bacillus kwashiorkori]|uniref:low molecular weight protein arginine phosphatase n=1 Tax=Bacillus kwashiorkori TaxID=1522318 RepID=UPI0007863D78|nr:low molecular weight protein arginine phosphatase [Bacillus kwashiorkori]